MTYRDTTRERNASVEWKKILFSWRYGTGIGTDREYIIIIFLSIKVEEDVAEQEVVETYKTLLL